MHMFGRMKAISMVNTIVTDLGSEVVFWFDVAHAHGHSTLMCSASQILSNIGIRLG